MSESWVTHTHKNTRWRMGIASCLCVACILPTVLPHWRHDPLSLCNNREVLRCWNCIFWKTVADYSNLTQKCHLLNNIPNKVYRHCTDVCFYSKLYNFQYMQYNNMVPFVLFHRNTETMFTCWPCTLHFRIITNHLCDVWSLISISRIYHVFHYFVGWTCLLAVHAFCHTNLVSVRLQMQTMHTLQIARRFGWHSTSSTLYTVSTVAAVVTWRNT